MANSPSHSQTDLVFRIYERMSRRAQKLGLIRQLIEDEVFRGDQITIQGQSVANFGLCSYLGLGDDKRLAEAAKDAIDRYGTSYSSSLAYTALPLSKDVRERLAQIFGAHIVLAPTTTLAHLAALPVLIRSDDHVLVDGRVHASVAMATQLLQANGVSVHAVPHNDLVRLEELVADAGESRRVWYLTDGVFSMDGDMAPAAEINTLLDRYDNLNVYCDDAHGFGWAGQHGRGTYLDRAGWHDRLVVVAGLSKSFGATGGVVATTNPERAAAIEVTGGPLIFGGPIPPAALGAAVVSGDIHLSDELPDRQAELGRRIEFVNRFAEEIGLDFTAREHSPLWFLDVGDARNALELVRVMKQSGFYLNGASFPAVPLGHAGVRFTVTLYNSLQQIEDMLVCLNDKRLELFGKTEIVIDLEKAGALGKQAEAEKTQAEAEKTQAIKS